MRQFGGHVLHRCESAQVAPRREPWALRVPDQLSPNISDHEIDGVREISTDRPEAERGEVGSRAEKSGSASRTRSLLPRF